MTVAATKTKAEQALSRNFEAVAAKLPGGRAVAEARKAAIGAFAALGLPHRRIEEWKYTDLRVALKEALPPAVGGAGAGVGGARSTRRWRRWPRSMPTASCSSTARTRRAFGRCRCRGPGGRAAGGGARASPGDGQLIREGAPGQEAVIALNTAFMTDGAVVRIAEGAKLGQAAAARVRPRRRGRRASSPRATSSAWRPARAPPSSRRMWRCRAPRPARPTR